MWFNIRERGTSYCFLRLPFIPWNFSERSLPLYKLKKRYMRKKIEYCYPVTESLLYKNWNYKSWVAVVTPTESPKSVRNRCVVFGGVFVLSRCFVELFGRRTSFVIGRSQISSFFPHHIWRNGSGKLTAGVNLGKKQKCWFLFCLWPLNWHEKLYTPVRTPVVSDENTSSVSQVFRKRRLNGAVSRNNRIKRVAPCRCRTGTLKNPTKCLWRWEPDRRYNFFFGPPAHLCRHIYNRNIVACDVKHQYKQANKQKLYTTGNCPHNFSYRTFILNR